MSLSDGLVIFGASGDLAYKKIFPALYAMSRRGRLDVPVVGVARTKWSVDEFRNRARESIEKQVGSGVDRQAVAALLQRLHYVSGEYSAPETFTGIRERLGAIERPAHYLAI